MKSSVPCTTLYGFDFSFWASNLQPPHIRSSVSSTYICNLHFYYRNLGAPFEAISIRDLEETVETESNFKGMEFHPPTPDGSSHSQGRVTNYSWDFIVSMWSETGAVCISKPTLPSFRRDQKKASPEHTWVVQATEPASSCGNISNIQRSLVTCTSGKT